MTFVVLVLIQQSLSENYTLSVDDHARLYELESHKIGYHCAIPWFINSPLSCRSFFPHATDFTIVAKNIKSINLSVSAFRTSQYARRTQTASTSSDGSDRLRIVVVPHQPGFVVIRKAQPRVSKNQVRFRFCGAVKASTKNISHSTSLCFFETAGQTDGQTKTEYQRIRLHYIF